VYLLIPKSSRLRRIKKVNSKHFRNDEDQKKAIRIFSGANRMKQGVFKNFSGARRNKLRCSEHSRSQEEQTEVL
jgi:hypothetical protein